MVVADLGGAVFEDAFFPKGWPKNSKKTALPGGQNLS